jgi:hypothetical protein
MQVVHNLNECEQNTLPSPDGLEYLPDTGQCLGLESFFYLIQNVLEVRRRFMVV